ncbi:MAG: SDR family oxidoreductase [Rhodanobacter sp.]
MSESRRPQILITGANGQLGRLVIAKLLQTLPPAQITAAARHPASVSDLAALGVDVRVADYDRPDTLDAALAGIDRMLLVSSNNVTGRAAQHQNVIEAALRAGVRLVVYTSILHADTSTLALARDHRETEALLLKADLDTVMLRNGWYTENLVMSLESALANGAHYGCAGDGRIAAASRADYAEAAAAVLIAEQPEPVYELAGDNSFTLTEYAAEISRQSQQSVRYVDLSQADYDAALVAAGLPAPLAGMLANADACAAEGYLFDDSGELSRLIGRPATAMGNVVSAALAARSVLPVQAH